MPSSSFLRGPRLLPRFVLAALALAAAAPACSKDDAAAPGPTGALAGHRFPLTLTPLTPPITATADISLYFSVTDADGIGVPDLVSDDFVALEDGAPVDKLESSFATAPLSGKGLDAPTVLLLDLSGSIVAGGAIDEVKAAAKAIVEAMVPEQRMAIVTFAQKATVRQAFTADKAKLSAAVDAITQADGNSTNLYGAIAEAVGMWTDGFVDDPTQAKFEAGIGIVITDGRDTASQATLEQALAARQNKRLVTVGIGSEIAVDAMRQLGNAGFIQTASYESLKTDVAKVTGAMQTLSRSIYKANYCSPKIAGTHTLDFTVKGNEASAPVGPVVSSCAGPTTPEQAQTCVLGQQGGCSGASCCPFACPTTGTCHASAESARAACGDACADCSVMFGGVGGGGAPSPPEPAAGPSIDVTFAADGYDSKQCPAFWGAGCKAAKACCGTLSKGAAESCVAQVTQAGGDEAQCKGISQQRCPVYGAKCKDLAACCGTLDAAEQDACRAELDASMADEATCGTSKQRHCPVYGATCKALEACCDTLDPASKPACVAQLEASLGDEKVCGATKQSFCPAAGAACSALASCCASLAEPFATGCAADSQSAGFDEASCSKLMDWYCPVLGPKCSSLKACCDGLPPAERTACLKNLQSEATNEAACEVTEAGYCSGCGPGEIVCDGQCVNVSSDAANCGACGHACVVGVSCSSGACGTGSGCADESVACASCVEATCGMQMAACAADATCVGQAGKLFTCVCDSGLLACSQQGGGQVGMLAAQYLNCVFMSCGACQQ